ncbi:hypothetical protein LR48_Vigan10g284000 [Vigna angularis]|uniref:Uncharacterized protein n=1 Tax=Phaseolus angularis TaxID=3914 RepID=A0A0L9VPT9_PHAAN|nr:hypothetical protein LR48_Vigan10g284000 [Vigna angularis]
MSLEESPTMYRANQSKHMQKDARRQQEDARPGRLEGTLVQKRLGRSSRRQERGRSSRVEARADARPETQKRTLVQARQKRTLVQPGRTLVQRREQWTFVQLAEVDGFGSLVLWRCDFTSGAHGGREELVGTSPPLPLGLLLLPSSMFVSFRVLHGNGEPNPSCWD